MEMKAVTYSKSSLKVLDRMQPKLSGRIKAKVKHYAADPQSQANNVKALQGSPFIRLRVGDWRVIMDDQARVLFVIKIGARGDVYK